MGMDIEKDQEFFWLAKESLNAALPNGWTERKLLRTGQIYYVNKETGESIWEHPSDNKYKKRFADLKKLKVAEDAKAKRKQVAKTEEKLIDQNNSAFNSTAKYDAMNSPKVERLKGELADIRKKKELLSASKTAAGTLETIRKEHGRLEKKLKLEETKNMLKKEFAAPSLTKKKSNGERRRSSIEERDQRVKSRAWAMTWLSHIMDKKQHTSF